MDFSNCWISIVGGGAGGGLVIGGGVFYLDFFNLGPKDGFGAMVVCTRAGAMAHIAGQHAVGLLIGVRNARDVQGLTSAGVDFAFDIGFKVGDAIKGAGKLAMLAKAVINASGKAAQQEVGKKRVQGIMGDLSPDARGKAFYMITTPLGAGAGAGLWYEWQSLYPLGPQCWPHAPILWRLADNGRRLEMNCIPANDRETVRICFHAWDMYQPTLKNEVVWDDGRGYRREALEGTVVQRKLYALGSGNEEGVPLTGRMCYYGVRDRSLNPLANATLSFRPSAGPKDSMPIWKARCPVQVTTDREGKISGFERRLSSTSGSNEWLD